jgi:thiamine-phosphate pyrophosphorylase
MKPRLCYITDRRDLEPRPLLPRILTAVEAGVDIVQIREKDLPTRELLELVGAAVAAAAGTGVKVVVNYRLDIALAVGAHGVHLGMRSIPPEAARTAVDRLCLPDPFLVGVSCHSLEQALAAEIAGADYILLGPIFPTPSKLAYGPPLGLEKLRDVTASVKVPVFALGGIGVAQVRSCLAAGAAGIAGIRIFQETETLAARVRELRSQFTAEAAAPDR